MMYSVIFGLGCVNRRAVCLDVFMDTTDIYLLQKWEFALPYIRRKKKGLPSYYSHIHSNISTKLCCECESKCDRDVDVDAKAVKVLW